MPETVSPQSLNGPIGYRRDWQQGIRWFLAEFLVVVLGILMALALNGWWNDRVDRTHERALLLGMKMEFLANLDLFDRTADFHRQTIEQARQLLELTGPEPAAVVSTNIEKLLFPLLSELPSYHPAMGEVEAMLGAGQLGLIQNDQLRSALAGWPGVLAVVRETEDEMRNDVVLGFYPYMVDRIPLVTLDYQVGFIDTPGPSRFSSDYDSLLSDLAFENHVENRWVMAKFILNDGVPVRNRIVEILELINAELVER